MLQILPAWSRRISKEQRSVVIYHTSGGAWGRREVSQKGQLDGVHFRTHFGHWWSGEKHKTQTLHLWWGPCYVTIWQHWVWSCWWPGAWLLFTVKLSIETNGYRYQKLETALVETLGSAKSVFQLLHSHPLWLRRHCAQRAQHHLTVMLRGYKVLAREARNLKVVAYGLKPKLHAVDHINKDLRKQIKGKSPLILNPMAFSCEANESVVGHVSRIARRVNSRLASTRVLDRITIKVKSVVRKYKTQFKLRTGRFLRR